MAAASTQRKRRWQCPACATVNRAFRDDCFGTECNFQRKDLDGEDDSVRLGTANDDSKQFKELVEFKDENSNVIARLDPQLAKAIRSELADMVQGLMRQTDKKKRKKDNDKTCALQKQMRKGLQVLGDFDDLDALWGYTRRKFFSRAITAFELFRSAEETLRAASTDGACKVFRNATVYSIGGGPGNDLYGYLLFEKYGRGGLMEQEATEADQSNDSQPLLSVCDFAPGWKSIVDRVGELSGHDIKFHTCNLSFPLQSETNSSLQSNVSKVYLFCYVLSEVMGPDGNPPPLLEALFQRAQADPDNTTIFLFREPHDQALHRVLSRHADWKEGSQVWHLSHGGLMVVL